MGAALAKALASGVDFSTDMIVEVVLADAWPCCHSLGHGYGLGHGPGHGHDLGHGLGRAPRHGYGPGRGHARGNGVGSRAMALTMGMAQAMNLAMDTVLDVGMVVETVSAIAWLCRAMHLAVRTSLGRGLGHLGMGMLLDMGRCCAGSVTPQALHRRLPTLPWASLQLLPPGPSATLGQQSISDMIYVCSYSEFPNGS